jgi:flagellar protein FlaG
MTNEIGTMRPGLQQAARTSPTASKEVPEENRVQRQAEAEAQAQARIKAETEAARQAGEKSPLEEVVSGLNDLVHELHRELQFSIDEDSGETVIKVIDRETDEVVRQIPGEEVIRLRKRLLESAGTIFQDSA